MQRPASLRAVLAAIILFVLAMALCAKLTFKVHASAPAAAQTSLTTEERVYGTGWWPTQSRAAAKDYAGEQACEACHGDITATQHLTPMYHAAVAVQAGPLLADGMTFREAGFLYSITEKDGAAVFSVRDGARKATLPIAWAFGNGEAGQTYLLQQNKSLVEARVSYYSATAALDITTGHATQPPSSTTEALGHILGADAAERCFGCHTTGSTLSGVFAPRSAVAGVTCEACHGPGAQHVEAMRAGRVGESARTIANPRSLGPVDQVDFCGACHRTTADVTVFLPANAGAALIRFQPYRLEQSRCWGSQGDALLTCIACHDPHKPLVRAAKDYDRACLACHGDAASKAVACKVGQEKCVTCHMPKVDVPQTHAAFTDHEIRIVQRNYRPRKFSAAGE